MGKYQVHRSDANAVDLYVLMEGAGASVAKIGRPVDAIIGFMGASALAEVKTPTGKLRPSQRDFLQGFRGAWAILRTPSDCNDLLMALSKRTAIPSWLQKLA